MLRFATLINLLTLVTVTGCYAGGASDLTSDVNSVHAAPRSLAGTAIDGELRTAADGSFVFDERARLAFDYFQTADGELGPAELASWVRTELGRSLPAAAADEAFAAWQVYSEFRSEAAAVLAQPTDDLGLAERSLLAAVDEMLADYPIAADERAQISRGFALQRIDALTGEARELALADFTAHQPEAAEAPGEQYLTARREIAAAQLTGAKDLQALRSQHFGAEAAARLAELDARRAEWSRRVAALQTAREALRAELSGAPLAAAIAELERRDFSPAELRRIDALDSLAAR